MYPDVVACVVLWDDEYLYNSTDLLNMFSDNRGSANENRKVG